MSYGMKSLPLSEVEGVQTEMEDRKDMAGTARDAQEMKRLGRQQQLDVCLLYTLTALGLG